VCRLSVHCTGRGRATAIDLEIGLALCARTRRYNGGVLVGPPTSVLDKMGETRTLLLDNKMPEHVIQSAVDYARQEGLLMKVRPSLCLILHHPSNMDSSCADDRAMLSCPHRQVYSRKNGICSLTSCGDFDYDEKQVCQPHHCVHACMCVRARVCARGVSRPSTPPCPPRWFQPRFARTQSPRTQLTWFPTGRIFLRLRRVCVPTQSRCGDDSA
jgi:hypothetical protein